MIRKDYLLRQLNQILEGVTQKFKNIQDDLEKYEPEEIGNLYQKYFQLHKKFFFDHSIDIIAQYLKNEHTPEEVLARMQILSELLYGEGRLLNNQEIILKAYQALLFVDRQSATFDIKRKEKLEEIRHFGNIHF